MSEHQLVTSCFCLTSNRTAVMRLPYRSLTFVSLLMCVNLTASARNMSFMCDSDAVPLDSLQAMVLLSGEHVDATRQVNNEYTLPIAFFRMSPTNPAMREGMMSEADMRGVVDNTMLNSEDQFNSGQIGLSFAGYHEVSVGGDTVPQLQQAISAARAAIQSQYANRMYCIVITPPMYTTSLNCGSSGNPMWFSEDCILPGTSDILSHELGHVLNLLHTFNPGNSASQPNSFYIKRPDGTWADYLSDCPGELVDRSNCTTQGDRLCDTQSEINSCCQQVKDEDAEWHVRDRRNGQWHEGGTMYVPNFNSPAYQNHDEFWAHMEFYDMNFNSVSPCEMVTEVKDCNGVLHHNQYDDAGFYNLMSYAPAECPCRFSEDQFGVMHTRLQQPNAIRVDNVVTTIQVIADGDLDTDPLTFESLSAAFDYITLDFKQMYRVFVLPSYSGVEMDPISLSNHGYTDIVPNFNGRPVFVDLIGVESISGSGPDLTWVPAAQGDIIVHQDHLNENTPIQVHGRVDLTVQNIQFENFGNGRMFASNGGVPLASALDFQGSRLELRNCTFVDNGLNSTRMTTLDVCKGVVHFNPLQEPSLLVQNCIFADNRSPAGPAVAITMDNAGSAPVDSLRIIQCTFANNFFLSSAAQNLAMHVESAPGTLMRNCIFSGSDPLHGTPGNQIPIYVDLGAPREMGVVIESCLFDQEQWIVAGLPDLDPSNVVIHHESTPGYVDPTVQDYRLIWNSICMDNGSPLEPPNFDLTQSDIGWTPVYHVTDINGNHSGALDLGWYRVLNNSILSAEDIIISAGTVLRFDSGVNASFRAQGSYSGGYNIILGDLEGPRTALVAKDEWDPEELPCTGYSFGTTATAPYLANVEFNGVLFNFAPSLGLGFTRCNVNLDGENLVTYDFENVGLTFSTSDGQVSHFSETSGCGPRLGWVDQMTSAVDVSYVDFPPQTDAFFCNLFNSGTYAGQTVLQHNNGLSGNSISSGYDNIPILLFDCTVRQHHNQYEDLAAGGVYMADATLHMNNGAMNRFVRIQDYLPLTALVQGYDAAAMINVDCGYNSFVDPNILTRNRDFVEGGCENTDWNLNFWGIDCSTPVTTQFLQNRIPTCASATSNLSACPTDVIPCPDQIAESGLYAYGEEANQIGNHQAAVAYWTELLEEYPESKYALSVTGWVKSLGITTLYGEDEYAHVVERLIDAAQASSGVEPHLSVYEFASAQCVEAYHGNRQGAIAVLDSMALALKDPDDIKTVTYARLEVDTYPPQGQMNAMAAGDWVQAERNQRQAIRRLQEAMAPGAARVAEEGVEPQASVPSSFLLERPVPNPFNPRTRLTLQVPAEGEVRVRVYNVQGQVVTTLREGRIRAGRHELVVEAGSWASGVYLVRAEFQGQVQTQKLVLVK